MSSLSSVSQTRPIRAVHGTLLSTTSPRPPRTVPTTSVNSPLQPPCSATAELSWLRGRFSWKLGVSCALSKETYDSSGRSSQPPTTGPLLPRTLVGAAEPRSVTPRTGPSPAAPPPRPPRARPTVCPWREDSTPHSSHTPTPHQGALEPNSFRPAGGSSCPWDSLTFTSGRKESVHPPAAATLVFRTLFDCKLFWVQTLCPLRMYFFTDVELGQELFERLFALVCVAPRVLCARDEWPRTHSAGSLRLLLLTRDPSPAQALLRPDPRSRHGGAWPPRRGLRLPALSSSNPAAAHLPAPGGLPVREHRSGRPNCTWESQPHVKTRPSPRRGFPEHSPSISFSFWAVAGWPGSPRGGQAVRGSASPHRPTGPLPLLSPRCPRTCS